MSTPPEVPKTTDLKRIAESFLWAPRIPFETPRYFPRLTPRIRVACWRFGRRAADFLFERGVDTSTYKILDEHYHPDRVWYTPSGWSFLRRALSPSDIDNRDVFVDFGCGKGRVLYQAAKHSFRRVVGVEVSAELSEIARSNLEANRGRFKCQEFEVITADAAQFIVPDDMTVAYFYDPFVGDTFRRVLENIVASLDRRPRPIRIVYAIPIMGDEILATGRFRRTRRVKLLHERTVHYIDVYDSLAQ